ncbi:hypothetical protein POM88_001373 [Heracleum sosnowskyi]|uniref:Protease Do-like PDZ domain-containing protein n=1 Tax=Heracleum sosnowskyi TaxID=360622 RepID=A0AAD8JDE7_9APIA|nr:hypothetical protein POM88_001373 [Heracleum sosnowskyi]
MVDAQNLTLKNVTSYITNIGITFILREGDSREYNKSLRIGVVLSGEHAPGGHTVISEFVYLRDNLLSTLEGIETLKRVKVLDLSFNDFQGPGFEPLENYKALQPTTVTGFFPVPVQCFPLPYDIFHLVTSCFSIRSVLVADINIGYEEIVNTQVHAFNGKPVKNLKGLAYMVEKCDEEFLKFHLEYEQIVVLQTEKAKAATPDILTTHCIPSAMSDDLKA